MSNREMEALLLLARNAKRQSFIAKVIAVAALSVSAAAVAAQVIFIIHGWI